MGDSDLSREDRRGLVVFPAESRNASHAPPRSEWWLVVASIIVATAMIAIAFALR